MGFQEKVTLMFESINKTRRDLQMTESQLTRIQKRVNSFSGVMQLNNRNFAMMAQNSERFNSTGARFARNVRMMTVGLHGFRMEMLSVMFFGMMLAGVFKAMMSPAMETFGVFQLWQDLLLITFIPIMEELMPLFLELFEFVSNLPEPVQKMIGIFTVLMIVLGSLMMVVGQLVLGIGGLVVAFGGGGAFAGIAPIIGKIAAAFAGLFSWVGLIVAIIGAGLFLAWRDNFLKMRDSVQMLWDGIKGIFSGIFTFIKGIVQIIFGLLTGNVEMFIEGFKNLFVGLKSFVVGIFDFIVGLVRVIGTAILKIFTNVLKLGFDLIKKLWNKVKEFGSFVGDKIGLGDGGSGKMRSFNDVILRPGQPPIQVSRNDTIVAAKSGLGGGGGENVTIAPVFNINVSDKNEMKKEIENANNRMIDNLRRVLKVDIR